MRGVDIACVRSRNFHGSVFLIPVVKKRNEWAWMLPHIYRRKYIHKEMEAREAITANDLAVLYSSELV